MATLFYNGTGIPSRPILGEWTARVMGKSYSAAAGSQDAEGFTYDKRGRYTEEQAEQVHANVLSIGFEDKESLARDPDKREALNKARSNQKTFEDNLSRIQAEREAALEEQKQELARVVDKIERLRRGEENSKLTESERNTFLEASRQRGGWAAGVIMERGIYSITHNVARSAPAA